MEVRHLSHEFSDFTKPNPAGEPVYLQIVRQFKMLALQGRFKNGDEAPSRRLLAAQLGVNPNTVQKAFVELEKEGLIKTPPNAKSVVSINEAVLDRLKAELIIGQISALVEAAKGSGLSCDRLLSMVADEWERP